MKETAGCVAVVIVFAIGAYAAAIFLLRWAWNTLGRDLFGWPQIEWWHALALLILVSIIGGAFRSVVSVERRA